MLSIIRQRNICFHSIKFILISLTFLCQGFGNYILIMKQMQHECEIINRSFGASCPGHTFGLVGWLTNITNCVLFVLWASPNCQTHTHTHHLACLNWKKQFILVKFVRIFAYAICPQPSMCLHFQKQNCQKYPGIVCNKYLLIDKDNLGEGAQ